MFARTSAWWQDRLLIDHPWRRQGGGALRCVVWEQDGKPSAYAFYRVNHSVRAWQFQRPYFRGRGDGRLRREATHAIWRYLFDIDWLARFEGDLPAASIIR